MYQGERHTRVTGFSASATSDAASAAAANNEEGSDEEEVVARARAPAASCRTSAAVSLVSSPSPLRSSLVFLLLNSRDSYRARCAPSEVPFRGETM
jgi:hypothetical protein